VSGRHEPVLLDATLGFLLAGPGLYLDATLGDAGHAEALLDSEPGARLLGCDRDAAALARSAPRLARFGTRVMLAHAAFRDLPRAHAGVGGEPLAGALFDLGVSSPQLDEPERGMSFRADGPLDLRMDLDRGETAAAWLARAGADEIARVLQEYGDVPDARRIARVLAATAAAGALSTTSQLAAAIARATGGRPHPRRLAQVFQALRMQVNDETGELDAALAWLPSAVRPGGVVVTLAYHSGEDRRIKRMLRGAPRPMSHRRLPSALDTGAPESPWQELTRKVVSPSDEEEARNPRARSARLRAFRRKPL
jgi:16S rRNA (cytosine1402-N4)-methyltransferase